MGEQQSGVYVEHDPPRICVCICARQCKGEYLVHGVLCDDGDGGGRHTKREPIRHQLFGFMPGALGLVRLLVQVAKASFFFK